MSRRTRRQFKSTQDKESKFIACLLANGPRPNGFVSATVPTNPRNLSDYKQEIMAWWRATHTSEPQITDKACHRFYNRYTRWLAQQRYHRRKEERDAQEA